MRRHGGIYERVWQGGSPWLTVGKNPGATGATREPASLRARDLIRETYMASAETILKWLKEAGAYASKLEGPTYALARAGMSTGQPVLLVEVLVKGSVVGVRAMRAGREKYESCTWSELEGAETNPLLALIDEVVAALG